MPSSSSSSHTAATPSVEHVSAIGDDVVARGAIAIALEAVAREVEPLAATFFLLDGSGEIEASIVHGTQRPPAGLARAVRRWKGELRGIDPLAPRRLAALGRRVAVLSEVVGSPRAVLQDGRLLRAYRRIGAINDVRLPIWDGNRLIAGVTLWRPLRSPSWSAAQLRALEALRPLVEAAYLAALRAESGAGAGLPATLTPRQREVARLLAGGATNIEVARALYISPDTAKSHTRAVMREMGVSSRREVVRRLARDEETEGSPPAPAGDVPIQLEGAERPGAVLALVLAWAAERIGAAAGGCTLLSARHEHVAEAWGVSRRAAQPLDPRLARRLQRRLLPAASPSWVLRHVAVDPARWGVIELDGAGAVRERLGELLTSAGLEMPLVIALRAQGRVAALLWLAPQSTGATDRREAARALRTLHPLLAMACAPTLRVALSIATAADLERRGLTPREVTVARLAIAGDDNATIARKLGVTQTTVRNHMTRVLAKCGVHRRAHLMALAAADLTES